MTLVRMEIITLSGGLEVSVEALPINK